MNNVAFIRPQAQERLSTCNPNDSADIMRSAVLRLLAQARTEGMGNTSMILGLALTAIEEDREQMTRVSSVRG